MYAQSLEVFSDEWDQIHGGDKPFLVLHKRFTVKVGEYLELVRVEFGYGFDGVRPPVPAPFQTPNGSIGFILVRVTCVTPPGSYGLDEEHQVVGVRRLGF